MCELSDEYEVISLNDITNKIFITDLCYKKKNLICATTFVTDHNEKHYIRINLFKT